MEGMLHVPRRAAEKLRFLLRTFPAVFICGPRQCGKSTLARSVLPGWDFIDLEEPAALGRVRSDLQGFLESHARRVVFDEVQQLPELFSALRHFLDRHKSKGRYVLTGSADPAIVRSISESLAGRVGVLELTPFENVELAGTKLAAERWFWGGYPPVLALRQAAQRRAWIDGYVTHFLERDLPALGYRMSPERLRKLWMMLTHVHGNVINPTDLARSLGVSHHTVGAHLDVLEGAFMIRRLQPHFANVQKRLTKSPKVYVRDSGLLHFLAGIDSPSQLETWSRRGASFEGLVIEELATLAQRQYVRPYCAYWRTHAGAEVDLLLGAGEELLPIEIKLASAVDERDLRGIRSCMSDLGLHRGWVVYGGSTRERINRELELIPWQSIARGEVRLPWKTRPGRRATTD